MLVLSGIWFHRTYWLLRLLTHIRPHRIGGHRWLSRVERRVRIFLGERGREDPVPMIGGSALEDEVVESGARVLRESCASPGAPTSLDMLDHARSKALDDQ